MNLAEHSTSCRRSPAGAKAEHYRTYGVGFARSVITLPRQDSSEYWTGWGAGTGFFSQR